jgi:hypothetical protein
MEILDLSSLTKVPNTEENILTPSGEYVVLHKYFDNRWENMHLIYCFVLHDNEEVCVLKLDNTYAIPIISHYGSEDEDGNVRKCDW